MTVRDLVRPVRFTDDVAAMAAFLETLGLTRSSEADRGGWAVLVGGRGAIALHDAASSDLGAPAGETHLSFESADLEGLAADLRTAGLDVAPYDEAWGRAMLVPVPGGHEIHVDADSGDAYGYHRRAGDADPRWTVRPVWFLDPALRADAVRLLAGFGLTARPGADRWWAACEGPGGALGLHAPDDGGQVCGLGLETTEPLADLAARLRSAGLAPELCRGTDAGDLVRLTDPDGRTWEVHASPPRVGG